MLDTRGRSFSFGYMELVQLGRVPGASRVSIIGQCHNINTVDPPEVLWYDGGLYQWPTTADYVCVVSDNTADTSTGTGARAIQVTGLDASYNVISEVIGTNGLTPVQSTKKFLRVNQAINVAAGSARSNRGVVRVKGLTTGYSLAVIAPTLGFSRQAIYTVPAGHTLATRLYVVSMTRAQGNNASATVAITLRLPGGFDLTPSELAVSVNGVTTLEHNLNAGLPITEKTDVFLFATSVSSNGTSVNGFIEGILINNSLI